MKKLILISFLFSFSLSASEFCPILSQSDALTKLAEELEATCDWSIKELAINAVYNECVKAQKDDPSIRFKADPGKKEMRFTKFGNTYNSKEANIKCKHKTAYEIRLKQITEQLEREAYTAQRELNRARDKESAATRPTSPIPPPQSDKKQLWKCRVPNYVKTFRIVDDAEKTLIEETYGPSCLRHHQ